MSVKIRLMRMGKKKQPTYRVVVADGRSPRDGRYIEILGQYRPREEPSHFAVNDEKVLAWLRKGAQPTDQVHRLLVNAGHLGALRVRRASSESRAVRTARREGEGCRRRREGRARRRAPKRRPPRREAEGRRPKRSRAAEAEAAAAEAKPPRPRTPPPRRRRPTDEAAERATSATDVTTTT